ncbi:uncharacterized protein SCHCODRAFT_02608521 [Schizophyllum commune H4-8]|uniref:uncharacterized protein n=1 Tax=Schizophyllum commune (strain H4-8 / FGSC 9210) TaxID=578458 RepID=UPI002160CBB0|nr:uncharacterized protein SCHCODRAFT_02608521 [Schizophyllum commune H4-8]KAI5900663.1 hypothetical protein SCHCODRAFT_02608521 [Schizophyllum commune H4-8]
MRARWTVLTGFFVISLVVIVRDRIQTRFFCTLRSPLLPDRPTPQRPQRNISHFREPRSRSRARDVQSATRRRSAPRPAPLLGEYNLLILSGSPS